MKGHSLVPDQPGARLAGAPQIQHTRPAQIEKIAINKGLTTLISPDCATDLHALLWVLVGLFRRGWVGTRPYYYQKSFPPLCLPPNNTYPWKGRRWRRQRSVPPLRHRPSSGKQTAQPSTPLHHTQLTAYAQPPTWFGFSSSGLWMTTEPPRGLSISSRMRSRAASASCCCCMAQSGVAVAVNKFPGCSCCPEGFSLGYARYPTTRDRADTRAQQQQNQPAEPQSLPASPA